MSTIDGITTRAPAGGRACRGGGRCLPIPILAMSRGDEQKHMNPTHNLACPACGETWEGSKTAVARAERTERGYDRMQAANEKQRKDALLRARLAAAPKARPTPDETT